MPDLTYGFPGAAGRHRAELPVPAAQRLLVPYTLTIALFRGYAVQYVPFAPPARVGHSKVRPLKDGLRFLLTITRLGTLFVPLKIFLPISLFLILTGGGYTLGQLILVSRFSGFGGLVFTLGMLVFLLGLISEQIALLRFVNSER